MLTAPKPTTGEGFIYEPESKKKSGTQGVDEAINPKVTDMFGPWTLAKQYTRRYTSLQNNQEGNEERRKGNPLIRTLLRKNQRDNSKGKMLS